MVMFEQINDNELPVYPISSVAKLLNISVHTLRMYEREGLLIPFRKTTGHRLYSNSDVERLRCIRKSINERKISIEGIKTIYSLIPCWKITNCSKKDRLKCESFINHSKPCWTFKHNGNICANLPCRECLVYKDYSDCKKIKESISELTLMDNN